VFLEVERRERELKDGKKGSGCGWRGGEIEWEGECASEDSEQHSEARASERRKGGEE
jgi:hypothetical protein